MKWQLNTCVHFFTEQKMSALHDPWNKKFLKDFVSKKNLAKPTPSFNCFEQKMIQQILQFYGKRYFKALFPKGKGKVEFVIFKLPQKEMRQIFLGLI